MSVRWLFLLLLITSATASNGQDKGKSPLSAYAKEWDDPKYAVCNTAANASYLSDSEKLVVYILNLVRMNPKLFAKTVLPYAQEIDQHEDTSDAYYFKSLVAQMDTLNPMTILQPDEKVYEGARCHAVTIGELGLVTHARQNEECKNKEFCYGECCAFGLERPLAIIVGLLIDQGTESLGHRETLFRTYYRVGVAMAPHTRYKVGTVLDFMYNY